MQRCRFDQTSSLDQGLQAEAERLREEAQSAAPGMQRENLIRKARQADTASHMQEWLSSPGLRAPQ